MMNLKYTNIIRVIFLTLFLSLATYAKSTSTISYNANSIGASVRSDSLAMAGYYFSQGMKLYKEEKFKECISYFENAYNLDTLLYIDSRPQVLTYISMWIGNAKRRAGIKIEEKSEYTFIKNG